jgi:hypothetical protein
MKLYTVAKKKNVCFGHGGYYDEKQIVPMGSYGEGEFPPLFKTTEEAEQFIQTMNYKTDKIVVSLNLAGLK